VVERSLAPMRPTSCAALSWTLLLHSRRCREILQVIEIPSRGPITDVDVYFIWEVWREMQHDIVEQHVVVQIVAMVDIVHSIQECPS
jgi:hypothetical protein